MRGTNLVGVNYHQPVKFEPSEDYRCDFYAKIYGNFNTCQSGAKNYNVKPNFRKKIRSIFQSVL